MIKNILTLLLVFVSYSVFSKDPNIAAVVDEKTRQIDIVFVSKIGVMLFLGIIAFLSYLKFRKTEP